MDQTSTNFVKCLRNGFLIGAGAAAYLYYQNYTIQTTEYYVESPRYAGALTGFTIAQLSDLHFPDQRVSFSALIEKTADIKPDIIVLSGDIITGSLENGELDQLFEFGKGLVQLAPTFAVFGNHDLASPISRQMERVLIEAGVQFLHDDAITYSYRGVPITIMGLMEKRHLDALHGDALRFINLTSAQLQQPKILIAHHPEVFLRYHEDIAKSPDLVIAGHAHGGQVRLPKIGGLYSPGQGKLPKYTSGVFFTPGNLSKSMVVSRGIGASSFPLRINNRPEIVSIQLTDSVERSVAGAEQAVAYLAEEGLISTRKSKRNACKHWLTAKESSK